MTSQKILLNPVDIRTMAKDIRQLKKFGIASKPKEEIKVIKKEDFIRQDFKKDAREKEAFQKIFEQSAKERYKIEKGQILREGIEVRDQTQAVPSKPIEQGQVKEMPPVVKETLRVATDGEKEQRRKFMEDIEAWAKENK